jgi:hypothetical protein
VFNFKKLNLLKPVNPITTITMICTAKNGCSSDITFQGKKVYFDWDYGIPFSSLGKKLDKTEFLKNLVDNNNLPAVEAMLADWELYENGWHVVYPKGGYKHPQLFYYLRQYGTASEPKELDYFN